MVWVIEAEPDGKRCIAVLTEANKGNALVSCSVASHPRNPRRTRRRRGPDEIKAKRTKMDDKFHTDVVRRGTAEL